MAHMEMESSSGQTQPNKCFTGNTHLREVVDGLIHRLLNHKPVHGHGLCLPQPMAPVLRLAVNLHGITSSTVSSLVKRARTRVWS